MNDFKLEQFSGPLDLLLNLIGEEKLDISEISLSTVTEQFLKYLESIENKKPEELADFLVVATRLLLLKSKNLLPQLQSDEDEGPSLEDQLRLYKAFIEVSKKLNKRWLENKKSNFRIEPPKRPEGFVPPTNFNLNSLHDSITNLLRRLKPLKELPQTQMDRGITVKDKLDQIINFLKKSKSFSFQEVLNSSQNRTEVIMTFLALLELVKDQVVHLRQEESFADITIEKV